MTDRQHQVCLAAKILACCENYQNNTFVSALRWSSGWKSTMFSRTCHSKLLTIDNSVSDWRAIMTMNRRVIDWREGSGSSRLCNGWMTMIEQRKWSSKANKWRRGFISSAEWPRFLFIMVPKIISPGFVDFFSEGHENKFDFSSPWFVFGSPAFGWWYDFSTGSRSGIDKKFPRSSWRNTWGSSPE